jgi:hypothetical protein
MEKQSMGRKANWIIEKELALRKEPWTLKGPGRLVKVVTEGEERAAASGYITTGGRLLGMTAFEIRRALGLNVDNMKRGVRVYKLARFPYLDEYEYDLTAKYPGGLSYNPQTEEKAKYLEGSERIPQWHILEGATIPVQPDFLELTFGTKFTYEWLLK